MSSPLRPLRFQLSSWLTLALLVGACCSPFDVAAQQRSGEQPPAEGRLWNIDDEPFTYRLGRRTGSIWSDEFTLAPDESRAFVPGVNEQYIEYEGLRGYDSRGYVAIQYPQFEGVVRVHLPGRTVRGTLVPNWFHYRDANGISRWIQTSTLEDARRIRQSILKEPRMTPEEIEAWKRTLRANWVYFDSERRSLAEPLPLPVAQ